MTECYPSHYHSGSGADCGAYTRIGCRCSARAHYLVRVISPDRSETAWLCGVHLNEWRRLYASVRVLDYWEPHWLTHHHGDFEFKVDAAIGEMVGGWA